MSMAKAIINFNLEESNLKLLGEKGIIPPLLETQFQLALSGWCHLTGE